MAEDQSTYPNSISFTDSDRAWFDRFRWDLIAGRLARSGLEPEYQSRAMTLASFPVSTVPEMEAHETLSAFRESVFLFGDVGMGKTHLAQAALAEAIASGSGKGRYWLAQDYIDHVRDELLGNEGSGTRDIAISSDFLVLDDLGTEKPSGFSVRSIYFLIDARLRAKRPTVVCSNYTPETLGHRWLSGSEIDEIDVRRILDRFCLYRQIALRGKSYRRRR